MRVKLIVWLVFGMVGTWSVCLHPGSNSPVLLFAPRAQSPEPKAGPLAATATILSQKYCHVDATSFSVLMKVKVRLTNASDQPVIVSRKIGSPGLVRVARTTEAGEAGRFEYAPNVDTFVKENPPHPAFGDAPSLKNFIVLLRGETYEVKISTGVFGTKQTSSGHGLISRGPHVLQLGISTWPYYGYGDIDSLRKKWSRFGSLQSGVVYTNFILFKIPQEFANPPCSTR